MDEQTFINELAKQNIHLTEKQLQQFNIYYEQLIMWNEKVNLTAIVDKNEVYLKHFYDSIALSFYTDIEHVQKICDIGAGAGFPSIPLKICFPHLQVTIVDSLKKRINFLESLISNLELEGVHLVHSRAEDVGQHPKYRESFDLVTARAVARMSVLSEYCIPLCKIGGKFIALKGANVDDELNEADKATKVLGAKFVELCKYQLPIENSERSIVKVEKVHQTKKKYPRKAGLPAKSPIL